jgi:hypothetical protein
MTQEYPAKQTERFPFSLRARTGSRGLPLSVKLIRYILLGRGVRAV